MMDLRVALLGLGCILPVAVIGFELLTDNLHSISPVHQSTTVDAGVKVASVPPAAVDDLLVTALGRPLFNPTRRPPESVQGDGATAADLSDKRLTGLLVDAERHLAIFAVPGGKPLELTEGDSMNGWRIESIAPTEVALIGPSGTQTLQPKPDPTVTHQARVPPQRPTGPPQPGTPARSVAPPTPAPLPQQPAAAQPSVARTAPVPQSETAVLHRRRD